jgi:FAD:protein FMN transferase
VIADPWEILPGDGPHASPVTCRSTRAFGTVALVAVTCGERSARALEMLESDLQAVDDACSRFRADSELRRVERDSRGQPVPVGPLLFELLEVAMSVAVQTAGTVDPTVGSAMVELGYDRDFDELIADRDGHGGGTEGVDRPRPAPGWWQIRLDRGEESVAIPAGIHVDLGSTAKAFAADRSARRIAAALGCGVLVNLGGDVAVSGAGPEDGWLVGIAEGCTAPVAESDQVVSLRRGGLATSGTTARTWVHNGRRIHHILDPWTGAPASPVWSLVSTAASSCVEANAWSTAAVVWGADAVGNLTGLGVPARLVDAHGGSVITGSWPPLAVR